VRASEPAVPRESRATSGSKPSARGLDRVGKWTRTTQAKASIRVPAAVSEEASEISYFDRKCFSAATYLFKRNEEIFGEAEPAEYFYKVVEGAVRTYRVLSDGRRLIEAFHLPGDVFGLEMTRDYLSSADAVEDTRLMVCKRSPVSAVDTNAELIQLFLSAAECEIQRAKVHSRLLLGSAEGRLASLLLDLADRMHAQDRLELPMPRGDIADYLGLSVETVSRSFTNLEGAGLISLAEWGGRSVQLRNMGGLRHLSEQ